MTIDGVDLALPTSDVEWAVRLERSRQALTAWTMEARLPWADRGMTAAIARTEIAVLERYVAHMPVKLRADAAQLVHDWDELRLRLLEA